MSGGEVEALAHFVGCVFGEGAQVVATSHGGLTEIRGEITVARWAGG